jgi:hypothetical protein
MAFMQRRLEIALHPTLDWAKMCAVPTAGTFDSKLWIGFRGRWTSASDHMSINLTSSAHIPHIQDDGLTGLQQGEGLTAVRLREAAGDGE